MSFAKASIKRFNEDKGCAPPVGAYNPKEGEKKGAIVIEKTERFKNQKDATPGVGAFDISRSTPSKTPKPNESVCSQPSNMSFAKPKLKPMSNPADMAKIKELEKEIKKLLLERTDQGKQISQKEDDIVKLEGRLHTAQTDKSSLIAKVASLEKEQKEIKKSNEHLKNKVSTMENAGKRHEGIQTELSALKNQLDLKDKEIAHLKQELESAKAAHMSDYTVFEKIITTLEEKMSDLDINSHENCPKCDEDKENIQPEDNPDLNEKAVEGVRKNSIKEEKCKRKIEKLQKRFSEVIGGYSAKMMDFSHKYHEAVVRGDDLQQIITQKEKCLQDLRDTLTMEKQLFHDRLKDLGIESLEDMEQIGYLKGNVSSVVENIKIKDQRIFEANAEIAALREKLDNLDEEKNVLNGNIQSLTEKFHNIELALDEEQTKSKQSLEQLDAQLRVTRDNLLDLQTEHDVLQCKNKELIRCLNKEKGERETLAYQLSDQEVSSGGMLTLVQTKEELIADLEIQLEANRVEMKHVKEAMDEQCEKIQHLQNQVTELERSLKEKEDLFTSTESQNQQKDMEMSNIQSELSTVQAEREDLKNVVKEYEEKMEVYRERIGKYETEITAVELKLEDMESDYFETAKENGNLLEEANKKVDQLTELKSELLKQINDLSSEKSQLVQEYSDLEKQLETHKKEMTECEQSLQNANLKLMDEVQDVKNKKEELDERVIALDNGRQEMEVTVKAREETIRGLQNELEAETQSKAALTSSLAKLKSRENEMSSVICDKEKAIESFKKEIGQLMKEIDYLSEVREQDQIETKDKLELYEKRISQLGEEKMKLENEIKFVDSEKKALESEVFILKSEIESLKEELEKERETVSGEIHTFTERIAEYKAEQYTSEQTIQDLDSKVESLQVENEELSSQCDHLQDKVTELKQESEKVEGLQIQLNNLSEENSCLTDQVGKSEETKCAMRKEIEKLESELSVIGEKLKKESENLQDNEKRFQALLQEEVHKRCVKEQETEKLQKQWTEDQQKWQLEIKSGIELLEKAQREVDNEKQLRKTLIEDNRKLEQNFSRLESDSHEYKKQFHRLQDEYKTSVEHIKVLTAELNGAHSENTKLTERVNQVENFLEEQTREIEDIRMKHEEELTQIQNNTKSSSDPEELDRLTAECEKWQKLYEDLSTKVEPFMEQLDAFELEKQALLGRSNHAQAEIDKLSTQYAKLLGHQNQKQKIHHIIKMKEENNSLRKARTFLYTFFEKLHEVTSLKEQCSKQKRTITKLEEKLDTKDGKKRFDPSKAFSFFKGKENDGATPSATPLKEADINSPTWSSKRLSLPVRSTKLKKCDKCGKQKPNGNLPHAWSEAWYL
ncbi:hypothetical protein FSP39_019743 [Pinctada imbricata]|uniref:Hyaluronan-mediated motility receptor C-terminal domain-containing protein n=1 Tax=Pinctada imbricata TaxID=66713 RepID=A0AA88Y923_PINIB|nr:hypothetical protein FSP39_019743 [Pinctada imbricata]